MEQDLENLEEKLKRKEKKPHKESGRSVFKLKTIIENKVKKEGDGANSKAVAGDDSGGSSKT